jgi:GNAT superfamily N-acetyltransferase
VNVREYADSDEGSWLRCRALSFLGTAYFDDVRRTRPAVQRPGFGLVAVEGPEVIGVLDLEVNGPHATIDTIAVHPDHWRRGIARVLLAEAVARADAEIIDAWTRDDPATLHWYRAMGFAESDHYLHVYANHYTDSGEPERAVRPARPGLEPIAAFLHAAMADEQALREQFARVHVCRRFSMPLRGGGRRGVRQDFDCR